MVLGNKSLLLACAALFFSFSHSVEGFADTNGTSASGKVVVSFHYAEQKGWASNQFAVWIEDSRGTVVKTLFVPKFTGKRGWEKREDTLSEWVTRARAATLSDAELSAITGATPKSGQRAYTWDLTDARGAFVPPGEYTFVVEGTLRWKNRVLYSGKIKTDGTAQRVEAKGLFFGDSEKERGMLTGVRAEYFP